LKFLGQAKKFLKVLQAEPETKVQHFNVRCGSGHRVRGDRTEGYQALRCPACGEGVFVLPRSPLPVPAVPKRPETSRSRRSVERMVDEDPVELTDPARGSVDFGGDEHVAGDADIVWDDELPEAPPQAATPKPKPLLSPRGSVDLGIAGPPDAAAGGTAGAKAARPGAQSRRRRSRETPPLQRPPAARAAPRDDRLSPGPKAALATRNGEAELVFDVKPSWMRSPHRWLLMLVPLVVIATVGLRYRQYLRQEYPLIAEKGRTEGIPALEAGEFDKANQLLSAAKSAVDALGGAVEGADEIRQAADEAAIYARLVPKDLGELLGEAGREPDAWPSRFETLYRGRSILIDSIVVAVPDGSDSSKFELAVRILPPGEAANREGRPERYGVFDLSGFQLFEQAPPAVGERKIFGARLESFAYDLRSDRWVVRLMAKSGVEILHPKALDSLHWRDDSIPAPDEPKEDRP
jgi:DNA-directed RNA polymerase subunit RPC12/RpoP